MRTTQERKTAEIASGVRQWVTHWLLHAQAADVAAHADVQPACQRAVKTSQGLR